MMKDTFKSLVMMSILPLIFISTSFEMALLAGLVMVVVTLAIKGLSLWLDTFVSKKIAVYSYILLSAALITVFSIIFQTFYSITELLGIYLSLILVNIAMMSESDEKVSFVTYLKMVGIGFGLLLIIGLLREILGTGAFKLGIFGLDAITIFDAKFAFSFLVNASGGYILAGIVFGVYQGIEFKSKEVDQHGV